MIPQRSEMDHFCLVFIGQSDMAMAKFKEAWKRLEVESQGDQYNHKMHHLISLPGPKLAIRYGNKTPSLILRSSQSKEEDRQTV